MEPIERFKKTNTEGNLWIYFLILAKDQEIIASDAPRLIFEKFGFLPGKILTATVLFRLQRQGFVLPERFQGKKAFRASKAGLAQLEAAKKFSRELLDKM